MSHFLLTSLLLPLFQPNGRIVQVSSVVNYSGTLDPTDVGRINYLETELGLKEGAFLSPKMFIGLYGDAKLAQITCAREMQARLKTSKIFRDKNIVVSSCHPGIVLVGIQILHL